MGWFWTSLPEDSDPELRSPSDGFTSKLDVVSGGAFWAPQVEVWAKPAFAPQPATAPQQQAKQAKQASACPVDHSKLNWFSRGKQDAAAPTAAPTAAPAAAAPPAAAPPAAAPPAADAAAPAQCPVDHSKLSSKFGGNWFSKDKGDAAAQTAAAEPAEPASQCPVDHSKLSGKFNNMNNMPSLSSSKLPGQKTALPTERTVSTIPKGDGTEFWEYPSPQQMLNAMVRKTGPDGIPEDAVESMVSVHNFLNEGVWQEVLEWERPHTEEAGVPPRLLRFQGRPGELSPKARAIQALGAIYPSKFGCPPPFDRHDWTVLRGVPGKRDEWTPVRYVIDFYEIPDVGGGGGDDDDDDPAFSVDVRPAADSMANLIDRARHTWGPLWTKAMGRD